jgi:hypothetical protein
MNPEDQNPNDPLAKMFRRSTELYEKIASMLNEADFDGSSRSEAAFSMCAVALQHGTALRARFSTSQNSRTHGCCTEKWTADGNQPQKN